MLCWYSCCPLIFRKNKPKRLAFKWDIVAMLILTGHDILAMGCVIPASHYHEQNLKYMYKRNYWPIGMPIIVASQLTTNFIIIFLMIELGFRLLEEGPWIGKVTIACLHVIPSVVYIAFMKLQFIFYMNIHSVLPEDMQTVHYTMTDIFYDMYGISVFHHIYVVLFETIITVITLLCCKKARVAPGVPVEDRPPFEEMTVKGVNKGNGPKAVKVRLELNSETRVFVPGAGIGGKITFEGAEEGTTPSATIDILGTAKVNWKEGVCCRPGVKREGVETVFSFRVTTSDEFQTSLPNDVPPTFSCEEGKNKGSISYCITATVNLNDGSPPFTIDLPFVVRPLQITTSMEPNEVKFSRQDTLGNLFGCLPIKNGPYGFADLTLPKTAFVIGEEIPFSVELFNRSRRPVLKVSASLISVVMISNVCSDVSSVYDNLLRKIIYTWDTITYGRVPICGGKKVWNGKLTVPKSAPESTTLPLCKTIELENYFFRFLVEIQGISEDVELDIPITIGPPAQPKYATYESLFTILSQSQSQSQGGETLTAGSQSPPPLALSQGSNVESVASNV